MKFGIAQSYWKDFKLYAPYVQEVGDYLNKVLADRSYGKNVQELILGITMYDEGSVAFYKKRKPKFVKGKKQESIEGLTYEIEDCLSYEIWLDVKKILESKGKKDLQRYVCGEIVDSFDQLKDMKSIRGFDVEGIQSEVAKLLSQEFQ